MYVNKIILSVILAGLSALLYAQQVQRDANFIFNTSDAIYSRDIVKFKANNQELALRSDSVSYENINGSPFWVDSSLPALLYNSKGYLGTVPVRINLVSNKLYFLKGTEEMILNDNIVTRIVFKTDNDSSVFIGQVPNLFLNNKSVTDFVQVLNFGKYQLLKYTRRRIASGESPSRTSKTYYFTDNANYFIKSGERVDELKKLNRENILVHLPSSFSYDAWIKKNNINFKNEKDIVRFLNYYNTRFGN
jgi:hypothetical protein